MRVYVASPYGFSAATRGFYDTTVLPAIRARGLEPLDPWADPDGAIAAAFAAADGRDDLAAINNRLGQANEDRIRGADAVLAILDGPDVDSGTAAEIGFAAALGLRVVGLRLDTRRTGDNEATLVNLQVEHWLAATATSLDQALALLLVTDG